MGLPIFPFLELYLTSMLSVFFFHPILVPISYCHFTSPVTFQLQHETAHYPFCPFLRAKFFLSVKINLQNCTELTQKNTGVWKAKTAKPSLGIWKLHYSRQQNHPPESSVCWLTTCFKLRLKWKWACHLSSLVKATACLKHRLCSANQLAHCKCLMFILYVICCCFYLGNKSISLWLVPPRFFNGT